MQQVLNSFIFNNPTKIFFGVGKLEQMHLEPMPGQKALILTSTGNSCKKNGAFDVVIEELKKADVEYVHLGNVVENPLKENCEEAGRFARENGCDFIIALGGGAVLDSAVPVSILATNGGDLWDYVSGGTGKGIVAHNKPLPIVTVATTSGTGSEINECAVISRNDTKEKIGIGDRRCKPVLAIVDPLYMKSIPPKYTAFQGFDAFFHHAEAMISNRLNMMSRMIALESIGYIYKYLPKAVEHGDDIEARTYIAYAATLSGMSMQLTRITAQHSMEHAMSAYHRNLPHGAGLIMIASEFFRFFIEKHIADDRFISMARVMGYQNSNDPMDFLSALEKLIINCHVDDLRMSKYGFVLDECSLLSKAARILQPGGYEVCPCEITDKDVENIFIKSYK